MQRSYKLFIKINIAVPESLQVSILLFKKKEIADVKQTGIYILPMFPVKGTDRKQTFEYSI